MTKYRVAMIGVGNISPAHQKMLAKIPDRCEVVGIWDINPETLKKKSELWGYKAYTSMDDLLTDKPDVAWIMTPAFPRIELFTQCCGAGMDIFTEKPLALNNKDAQTCVDIVRKAECTLGFGCNERSIPTSYTLAQLYFEGVLGKLIKVYAQTFIHRTNEFWAKKFDQPDSWRLSFENSGGRIFEFSIHLVNWLQWIGGDPLYVAGVNDAVSEALAESGLDDVVSGLLKFEQGYGVVETVMAPGNREKTHREMGIVGTKGECWLDNATGKIRLVVPEENRDEFIKPYKTPTKAENFFDSLDNANKPLNDADAALATTRICTAFNESVRTKQIVHLK